jgi:hypothetical protein
LVLFIFLTSVVIFISFEEDLFFVLNQNSEGFNHSNSSNPVFIPFNSYLSPFI